MDNKIKTWLFDIKKSINEINTFFEDEQRIFEDFQKDLRTKRAIERNIEIIGEAISRILKKNNSIEITNARKIVDTRNRIINGYDTVSDEVIWGIVINYLPKLKGEVEELIKEK